MGSILQKKKKSVAKTTTKSKAKKAPAKALKNYVNWFEIPVYSMERAVGFYNYIYGIEMKISENVQSKMAFFPANKGIGGALIQGEGFVPSKNGPLIYLNGGNDLSDVLSKITEAGGYVILPKTQLGEGAGFFALFIDTEGNKLALHSKK